MPFTEPRFLNTKTHILVAIEIPPAGEISSTGRSENLVDPTEWHDIPLGDDLVRMKVVACKVRRRHHGGCR